MVSKIPLNVYEYKYVRQVLFRQLFVIQNRFLKDHLGPFTIKLIYVPRIKRLPPGGSSKSINEMKSLDNQMDFRG